jgi:hypothetical protein
MNIFIDYRDLAAVKRLCDQMGPECVVIRHPERDNYNITHYSQRDRWEGKAEIVYRPGTK